MFTPQQISKMVFFDIETSTTTQDAGSLSPALQNQWHKRAEYLRDTLSQKYPDNKTLSDEDLFTQKAALQAEFGRIVCISFGRITYKDGEPTFTVAAISGENEEELLIKAQKSISKIFSTGGVLVGHNIKRFDIPYLCKRMLINGLSVPDELHFHNKKPWEIPMQDTMDVWSFGAWQEGFTSLDLICGVLGIPSPKGAMRGEEVPAAFWQGRLDEIAQYNMEDVIALGRIILKVSGLNLFEEESITRNTL
jgi:DNA polymerase III epsilon subunit-like protein